MERAKLWLRFAAGALVVALTVASGGVALGRERSGPHASPRQAVRVEPARAPLRPPVLVPPALPSPSPTPGDAFVPRTVHELGRISMPSIGVEHTVSEGVDQAALAVGPGHWPGTAEPGGWGNAVVAGHRVSHGGPFRSIDALAPGDPIVVQTAEGTFTYAVTAEHVVTPTDLWIVDQHPGRTITLFACHPLGSATHRYVVVGSLTSVVSPTSA